MKQKKKWINNCFLLKWENLYNLQIQQNFIDSNIKGGKNRQQMTQTALPRLKINIGSF